MTARVRLPEALHARPANRLVRLAQRLAAKVHITHGAKKADAANILQVLALGAAQGDEIVIEASGEGAEEALEAIRDLVENGFLGDRVPETGSPAVDGIAIGRAVVVMMEEAAAPAPGGESEPARVERAFVEADASLATLMASLPAREAALFEPETQILADLRARVLARAEAGEPAVDAVLAETELAPTDLIRDARARLLDALAAGSGPSTIRGVCEESVLVTDALTPSLVATLPPAIVGVVAATEHADGRPAGGFTSHAAILARGRGLPLVFVPAYVAAQIAHGELVVLDATASPANVWPSPSEALVRDVRAKQQARARDLAAVAESAAAPLAHLDVAVRANISSLDEVIPEGAEGVGLLRTELVFASRRSAPSEAEQYAAALAVLERARGGPVVARLFDAGADKPLCWLPAPKENGDARGMELLFLHRAVLATQVRALGRAGVRILLPLVRSAGDVDDVRALLAQPTEIGAMIETPEAVLEVDAIARAADFVCIGTNDLAAAVLGQAREVAVLSRDPRVFAMIAQVVERAHAAGRKVTVCGEIAGDPWGARALAGLGVDAISVAPSRLAGARSSLATATREDCAGAAREAMQGG